MKRCVLLVLFVAFSISFFANGIHPDTIASDMWRQISAFPQEKLYVQTDRAEYVIGDTIWMRHHVVDAVTGLPSLVSRYVYVELVSPMGGLVHRAMMRQDEHGAIYGYMPTSSTMPSGQYMLRAYTRYMADATPEYIFVRPLRLRNVMENSVRITVLSRRGTLSLSFENPKTGQPIYGGSVKITSRKGDVAFTGNTDKGISIHSLDIGRREQCLLVRLGNYEEYVPLVTERVDLQVMPEGGHLVMGQRCRVAYKAVAENGLGLDMVAVVTDDRDSVVAVSTATHKGMGMFSVTPRPGRSYVVTCTSTTGQTASVALPKAQTMLPSLSVTQSKGSVMVSILQPEPHCLRDSLWLVVHQEGAPIYVRKVGAQVVRFGRKMFRDGIANFVLADANMNIISERLAFVWNGNGVYESKDSLWCQDTNSGLCNVGISLPDNISANCAVGITDASCAADTSHSIVSALLLSQELHGYVEQPAWYFASAGRSGQLDLLMMTQGWRRYDVQDVLRGHIHTTTATPEVSMRVSGKVTSDVSPKGKRNVDVAISSTRGGVADVVQTDADGRFSLDGFEVSDSTGFVVMSRSARGGSNVVVWMDTVSYPRIGEIVPQAFSSSGHSDDGVWHRSVDRIAMLQGGCTMFLPEVTVETRYRPRTEYEGLAKLNGKTITQEELKNEGYKSLVDVLRGMHTGLLYDGGLGWFTYRGNETYLYVDDVLVNAMIVNGGKNKAPAGVHEFVYTFASTLNAQDILQIDILKGSMVGTLPGMSGNYDQGQSAVMVTTKRNVGSRANRNVAMMQPLGYQRPAEFYNPKYAVTYDYALRQTVYWNPEVRISNGNAEIDFLANGARSYRLTMEGIGADGRVIHIERYISLQGH